MTNNIFGNEFDFNHDGRMDDFESRAQATALIEEIRKQEGIETALSEMSEEQVSDLIAKSGVDLSGFGI